MTILGLRTALDTVWGDGRAVAESDARAVAEQLAAAEVHSSRTGAGSGGVDFRQFATLYQRAVVSARLGRSTQIDLRAAFLCFDSQERDGRLSEYVVQG